MAQQRESTMQVAGETGTVVEGTAALGGGWVGPKPIDEENAKVQKLLRDIAKEVRSSVEFRYGDLTTYHAVNYSKDITFHGMNYTFEIDIGNIFTTVCVNKPSVDGEAAVFKGFQEEAPKHSGIWNEISKATDDVQKICDAVVLNNFY